MVRQSLAIARSISTRTRGLLLASWRYTPPQWFFQTSFFEPGLFGLVAVGSGQRLLTLQRYPLRLQLVKVFLGILCRATDNSAAASLLGW
jgi:hypothetical protein